MPSTICVCICATTSLRCSHGVKTLSLCKETSKECASLLLPPSSVLPLTRTCVKKHEGVYVCAATAFRSAEKHLTNHTLISRKLPHQSNHGLLARPQNKAVYTHTHTHTHTHARTHTGNTSSFSLEDSPARKTRHKRRDFRHIFVHLHLGPLSPPLRVCILQLRRVFDLDVDAFGDARLHEVPHASKDLLEPKTTETPTPLHIWEWVPSKRVQEDPTDDDFNTDAQREQRPSNLPAF